MTPVANIRPTWDTNLSRSHSRKVTFISHDIVLSTGGSNLPLSSWMWSPAPTQEPQIHFERLVTSDCAPAMQILRGNETTAGPVLVTDYFFNIQTSIDDPTVFTLPSYCQQAQVVQRLSREDERDMIRWRLQGGIVTP